CAGEQAVAVAPTSDPWSGVDSAALRSIAGKSTSQIAAGMPKRGVLSGGSSTSSPAPSAASTPAANTAPAAPVAKGPVMAQVPYVTGAPGDGRSSLTAAI